MANRQQPTSFKFVLTSHRGAAGLAPENTFAAIAKGLELGADRIEIDVRQTSDGEVVVLHDRTLNRTTTGRGKLEKVAFSELKHLDASKGQFSKPEPIPSLREVLWLIAGKATLVIEVKEGSSRYPGIEENIVKAILENQAADWTIIHSFDDRVLNRFKRIAPDLEYHKLLSIKVPYFPLYKDTRWRLGSLKRYNWVNEISISHKFANRRVIKEVHQLNKPLNVWTVNNPRRMQKLLRRGVNGIITDHPQKAR